MKKLFIDMHCDTITTLYNKKEQEQYQGDLFQNILQLSLSGMEQAGYLLQNFAIFLSRGKCDRLYAEAVKRITFYYEELEKYKNLIEPVSSYKKIIENEAAGKMSALLTLEGGEILEGNVDNLHYFYELGVRMITLTWNYENELGYPNFDLEAFQTSGKERPDFTQVNTKQGLTPFGIELVREMERMHILVDVSHGSDGLFYDVCKYTKEPFVASHSNAREILNCSRNLSDEMIRLLAERGGVMGMNFCADFISKEGSRDKMTYTADIVRHMKHIKKVGGVACIGLGSDFDGIDNDVEFGGAAGMEQLYECMKKEGFTESECDKILRDNVLRIYRERL